MRPPMHARSPLLAAHYRAWIVLRHDVAASLVFLVAVPLSLGIAVATGAPVMAGLIAAVVGGIVAGLLGGSPLQVSAPRLGSPSATRWVRTNRRGHEYRGTARPTRRCSRSRGAGGAGGDSVLLIWPRLPHPLPSIPAPLVAVVGVTALATILALDVERVTPPGSLLASLNLPDVPGGSWGGVVTGVLTVAVIASVESLLSAVAVDKIAMAKSGKTNFDRELVGQGAANTLSGLLGALPVTGVIVRGATNVAAGARTRAACDGQRRPSGRGAAHAPRSE